MAIWTDRRDLCWPQQGVRRKHKIKRGHRLTTYYAVSADFIGDQETILREDDPPEAWARFRGRTVRPFEAAPLVPCWKCVYCGKSWK